VTQHYEIPLDPPFVQGVPSFTFIDCIPLDPNLDKSDLSPLRETIKETVKPYVGTRDVSTFTLLTSELLTNAAGFDDEDDERVTRHIDVSDALDRHAVALILGRSARGLVAGVTDDQASWTNNPNRPGTEDPIEPPPNVANGAELPPIVRDDLLEDMGTTGRGLELATLLGKVSFSRPLNNSGKTLWIGVELDQAA